MKVGLSPEAFWDMSHKEVIDYLNAKYESMEYDFKITAKQNHKLALMMNHAFNGSLKPITTYFPGLFEDEIKVRQDWRTSKANVLKFLNR